MPYLLMLILLLSGCVFNPVADPSEAIDSAIASHLAAAPQIHLGDDKEMVLAILEPIQARLSPKQRKPSESYLKDGATIEIYYARSGRVPDGLTTDDEFTPYVFTTGKLTAIGWTTLGGPKTVGTVGQGRQGGVGVIVTPGMAPAPPPVTCRSFGRTTRCY